MMQKIRTFLEKHPKEYELLRYLIAGVLTTLLSMLISYGVEFILAPKNPVEGSVLSWIAKTINLATPGQVMIANAVSWVMAAYSALCFLRRAWLCCWPKSV